MFEVVPHIALALILAAFVAGFVDSIAGGGGLIAVPALLLAGASPIETLATNKLQGSFGSGTAMITYARKGHIDLKAQAGMAAISAIAAAGGALVAHLIPANALRIIMPVVLIAVAIYFAVKPGLTDNDSRARVSNTLFSVTFVPVIAAYDGFFGPGTGSFFMLGFVLLAGYGLLRATAHTKTLNFASNIGSFAVFAFSGATWWAVGLCMGLAQLAGAAIGARLAMRIGGRLIKPLLVVTSTAMAARLLWQIWS
ncbi:MAG: TSUP family transporter [Cypionkella sp.]|nr:TSUP family transporter [Cypionkella sp.]